MAIISLGGAEKDSSDTSFGGMLNTLSGDSWRSRTSDSESDQAQAQESTKRKRRTVSTPRRKPRRTQRSTFIKTSKRSFDVNAETAKGTGEALYNLATGREDVGDVVEGAKSQGLRYMNVTGENVVDIATGGRGQELRERYRRDSAGRDQFERSQSNLQRRRDPLGQAGAVLEAGTDFALDQPGASVQDQTAKRLGGRKRLSAGYNWAATASDDALSKANLDTRSNWVSRGVADVLVGPVVKGPVAVATGTDLETGEKKNATGDDIVESALLPFAFTGGMGRTFVSAGARRGKSGVRGVSNLAASNAEKAHMVNPLNIFKLLRRGDDAAQTVSRSRRTVKSTDNLPVLRETTKRLEDAPSAREAPRRIEQSKQTRFSTNLDRLRSTEGGAGSPRLLRGTDDLPARIDDVEDAAPVRFKNSLAKYDVDGRPRSTSGIPGASRWSEEARSGASALENLRSAIPTQGMRRLFSRGDDSSSLLRRGDSDDAGLLTRLRRRAPGADDTAQARQSRRVADADARRAAQRPRDATSAARRSATDEDVARAFGGADDAASGRRSARTRRGARGRRTTRRATDDDVADAVRKTERGTGGGGAGGLISRVLRENPLQVFLGGSILGGAGAVALSDLVAPDQNIEGDSWRARQVKPYTVQASSGEATVYLYEVTSKADGSPMGYSVVAGADPDSGRLYYLSGNVERPSLATSRVTNEGLGRAVQRSGGAAGGAR